jgi:hypothetical protein
MLAQMRRGDSMKRRDVFAIAGGAVALSVGATGAQVGLTAQPMATAPRERERTVLLYCPEQGGWHTGEWFEGRWVSSADIETTLEPTHWMATPPESKET